MYINRIFFFLNITKKLNLYVEKMINVWQSLAFMTEAIESKDKQKKRIFF